MQAMSVKQLVSGVQSKGALNLLEKGDKIMATIRQWFDDKKSPDFIQFPKVEEDSYGMEQWYGVPTLPLEWEDPIVQPWLNLEFDDGFGSQEVPSFFAWTCDKVYYV